MPTKRLPFLVQPANRAGSTSIDAQLRNGLLEKDANDIVWCYKRPGLALETNLPGGSASFFGRSQYGYVAGSSTQILWAGGSYTNTSIGRILGGDSSGDGTVFYMLSSGAGGFTFNGSSISTSGAPTSVQNKPFVQGIVQLDQTYYAMDQAGGIYGSNVNDPTTWSSNNLIYANNSPGTAVALGRQLSYLLAFKQYDVEVFYDAANPTGSPLGSVPAQRILWGCGSGASIATIDDTILWMAQGNTGEYFISSMANLSARRVSTPAIDRVLLAYSTAPNVAYTGLGVKIMGHRLYLLQITSNSGGTTLVYDLDLRAWMTWDIPYQLIVGSVSAGAYTQLCDSVGQIFNFNQTLAVDGTTTTYSWVFTTPPFDGGTRAFKYLPRIDILTDNTPAKDLQIRWSDDDQVTWTNWKNVNLASRRPSLTNCGRFRRRTFQVQHTGPQPLRLQAIDLYLEEGVL